MWKHHQWQGGFNWAVSCKGTRVSLLSSGVLQILWENKVRDWCTNCLPHTFGFSHQSKREHTTGNRKDAIIFQNSPKQHFKQSGENPNSSFINFLKEGIESEGHTEASLILANQCFNDCSPFWFWAEERKWKHIRRLSMVVSHFRRAEAEDEGEIQRKHQQWLSLNEEFIISPPLKCFQIYRKE